MRMLMLLFCVALAGCNTTRTPSSELLPGTHGAPAPAGASPGSAAAAPAPAAADGPSGVRDVTEAKVICWGKVERDKRIRTIDQRIAYVERCVAEQMKAN